MGKQDRQSPRQSSEIRVRYKTHSEWITRFSEDVSEGGVFIRSLEFLPNLIEHSLRRDGD